MITSLLDRFMDFTVAPGYTNLGYAIRARAWEDRMPSLSGRTVLVTGGTSGLGRAAAEGFARLDARVLLLARNPERGARAVEEIASATGNPHVELSSATSATWPPSAPPRPTCRPAPTRCTSSSTTRGR